MSNDKKRSRLDWKMLSHPTVRDMVKGELLDKCDELQDAFDNRLRRQYGVLNICGLEVQAPEALHAVAEPIYKDRLRHYIDSALEFGDHVHIDGMILSCADIEEWLANNHELLKAIYHEVHRVEDLENE